MAADQLPIQEEEEVEFNGDVLETILSHVPLVDLVSASHVSKTWRAAAASSLRHRDRPRPWLIVHKQGTRFPYNTRMTLAYDPRSDVWVRISRPPVKHVSDLKSSHSSFVYMLSPSSFAFSFDPLNFDWCHAPPPRVWRIDPIVAVVGETVVVAGGGCDFEDDPYAVEIYDMNDRVWGSCDSMPMSMRDSCASIWLSIAATDEKLVVTERESGLTHWFDPGTKSWSLPFRLSLSRLVSSYNIGYTNIGLILVGPCVIQGVARVRIWRVREDDFECEEEIGDMPVEYVQKLWSKASRNFAINIRAAGDMVYMYSDSSDVEEMVACELKAGGGCTWWSVRNVVAREEMMAERLVFTCAEVGFEELERVMTVEKRRFEVCS